MDSQERHDTKEANLRVVEAEVQYKNTQLLGGDSAYLAASTARSLHSTL